MAQSAPSQQQVPRHKIQTPLDTLQSMVTGVLLETGKALRSANKKGVKTIGYDNTRLQEFVPIAIDRFHTALDELESEIVRAKAVLNRDLREIRARQYAIDHPSATHAEESMLSSDGKVLQSESPSDDAGGVSPASIKVEADQSQDLRQVGDKDTPNTGGADVPPLLELPTQTQAQEAMETSKQAAGARNIPGAEDVEMRGDSTSVEQPPTLAVDTSNASQSNLGEASALSGMDDMTFESMFDAGGASADNDINFDDLDFGGNDTNDQSQDFGNTGEISTCLALEVKHQATTT